MKLIALLTLVRDIIFGIKEIMSRVRRTIKEKNIQKALEKSKEEGDQRGVENALSGASGRPTKHKFDGLHTQKAKKRR